MIFELATEKDIHWTWKALVWVFNIVTLFIGPMIFFYGSMIKGYRTTYFTKKRILQKLKAKEVHIVRVSNTIQRPIYFDLNGYTLIFWRNEREFSLHEPELFGKCLVSSFHSGILDNKVHREIIQEIEYLIPEAIIKEAFEFYIYEMETLREKTQSMVNGKISKFLTRPSRIRQ